MNDCPRVAVLELGRAGALGATRRVETWTRLWRAVGAEVINVWLVPEHRARPLELPAAVFRCARSTDRAFETLAWSRDGARARLRGLAPDVVVATTARCWLPDVAPRGSVQVLDYVDVLSDSYLRRARAETSPLRRRGLQLLAGRLRTVESLQPPSVVRTAAGWRDALRLGAEWVPNVVDVPSFPAAAPDVDLLFVGTLSYAPNVEALERMSRVWPVLSGRRPATTLLVAGANPTPAVRALVARNGWELSADFPSLPAVCSRARVAVSPVRLSTGIQNKVLETAAQSLPQVIDPSVEQGLGPDFPARVAGTDDALVDALVSLLDDPAAAADLGRRARAHVESHFSVSRWAPWCQALLAGTGSPDWCAERRLTG